MLYTAKTLLVDYWKFNPQEIAVSQQLRSFFRDSEVFFVENNNVKYLLKATPIKLKNLIINNQQISSLVAQHQVSTIRPINDYIIKNDYIFELYPMMEPLDIEGINIICTNLNKIFTCLQSVTGDFPKLILTDINISNRHLNYLENALFKYFPFMETSFIHGDFHPHNIFLNDNTLYLTDWETAAIGPKLYDLAFFCGCYGLHGEEFLQSTNIGLLLQSISSNMFIDQLSIDTFHALLVYTRIRWLIVWEQNKDNEMVETENIYIDFLISNHDKLVSFWKENIVSNLTHNTKWIITDANFSKEVLELKNNDNFSQIDNSELSSKIPELIIAFGKDNNIKRNIDLLLLHEQFAKNATFINDLMISFINFSLDASRLKQKVALKHIISIVENKYADNEMTPISLAYLYRNYFTLLTENNDNNMIEVKNKLEKLLNTYPDKIELVEEYSRVLSGEINFFLINKKRNKAKKSYKILENLKNSYPESSKIAATYKVAKNNLESKSLN